MGAYTLGLYGSHKITCSDIDILANQPGTSFNGDQGAGEPVEALGEAIQFYNGLRLACRCRDAGIAFGVVGWYFPRRSRLNEGFCGMSHWALERTSCIKKDMLEVERMMLLIMILKLMSLREVGN